jgi:hypothetical protein
MKYETLAASPSQCGSQSYDALRVRFAATVGEQSEVEVDWWLLLVSLLEVGHLLVVHLAAPTVVASYVLVRPWCQPKKLGASSEGLFTEAP